MFCVISGPSGFNVMMSFLLFQHQYMTAPSNELKPVFSILTELLVGNRNWSSQGFTTKYRSYRYHDNLHIWYMLSVFMQLMNKVK